MNTFSKFLTFSFLILILASCNSPKKRNLAIVDETTHLEDQRKMLQNKNLIGINRIIGDSIDLRSRLLFLYNSNDCETCVQKGFHLTYVLDSIAKKQVVFVITSSANIGSDQIRYGYKNYVYYDEHDFLRSKLKYIYTPVFLLLDSLEIISDAFYPKYNIDTQNENVFINNYIKLLDFK